MALKFQAYMTIRNYDELVLLFSVVITMGYIRQGVRVRDI